MRSNPNDKVVKAEVVSQLVEISHVFIDLFSFVVLQSRCMYILYLAISFHAMND